MTEKTIRNFSAFGVVFTFVLGTLLHFVYDWFPSPLSRVVGAFNESTWEHLKLLVFPMLLFTIIEYIGYGREICGFFPIKIFSVLLGMFVIVASFYTYTGVVGSNYLICDIAVFLLGILASYWFAYEKLKKNLLLANEFSCTLKKPDGFFSHPAVSFLSFLLLISLIVCFIYFSYHAPNLPLFMPPEGH